MTTIANARYHPAAICLHWIMAGGYMFMWICGFAMTRMVPEDTTIEDILFGAHISVGAIMAMLMICRIATRILVKAPTPLAGLPPLECLAAAIGHYGLYLVGALVLLIGWAEVDFGGHGVQIFGLAMPKLFPTMEEFAGINLESTTELLHMILAYSLLALTILHVAAVVKHKHVDGHDVLPRMTLTR